MPRALVVIGSAIQAASVMGAVLLAGCEKDMPAVAAPEPPPAAANPPAPPAAIEAKPPIPELPPPPPDPLRAMVRQKVTLTGVAVSTPGGAALRGDNFYVAIADQAHWQGYAGLRVQVTGILEEMTKQIAIPRTKTKKPQTAPEYLVRNAIWSPVIEPPMAPPSKKASKSDARLATSGDAPAPVKPRTALELFNQLAQAEGKALACDDKAAKKLSRVKLVDGRLPDVFISGSSYTLGDYLDMVVERYGLTWAKSDAGYAISAQADPAN